MFAILFSVMALTSSVLFLLLISGDRFAAIFFPLRHIKKNVPTQTPYVAMTVAWILSIVVAIPNLLIRKMYEIQWKDHDQVWCVPRSGPGTSPVMMWSTEGVCIRTLKGRHTTYRWSF